MPHLDPLDAAMGFSGPQYYVPTLDELVAKWGHAAILKVFGGQIPANREERCLVNTALTERARPITGRLVFPSPEQRLKTGHVSDARFRVVWPKE